MKKLSQVIKYNKKQIPKPQEYHLPWTFSSMFGTRNEERIGVKGSS